MPRIVLEIKKVSTKNNLFSYLLKSEGERAIWEGKDIEKVEESQFWTIKLFLFIETFRKILIKRYYNNVSWYFGKTELLATKLKVIIWKQDYIFFKWLPHS